jgi:hypothetical protein
VPGPPGPGPPVGLAGLGCCSLCCELSLPCVFWTGGQCAVVQKHVSPTHGGPPMVEALTCCTGTSDTVAVAKTRTNPKMATIPICFGINISITASGRLY